MFHAVRPETFSRYVKSKQIISDYRKETQSLDCFLPFCMALLPAVIIVGATKGCPQDVK